MKVHFELMKCINDQLTCAKHASWSAAKASISYDRVWIECSRSKPKDSTLNHV